MANESLHTPQAKSMAMDMSSIMNAYKTQSKVEIGMSDMDPNGNVHATKDIPLSRLQPYAVVDETTGQLRAPSQSDRAKAAADARAIQKAYAEMNGEVVESNDNNETEGKEFSQELPDTRQYNLGTPPDDDEQLLTYLKALIFNFRKNLESLEAFYTSLTGEVA